MASPRPIRLPAADFDRKPLPVVAVGDLDGLRVHGMAHPPVQFRLVPSHRFSHPAAPGGLLYLGFDLDTCLWECFGDAIHGADTVIPASVWMNRKMGRIRSSASLRICDLTDVKTRTALKVDLSALSHTDLDVPQAWGLAIQNHPDAVDGLFYHSRFTNERCLVLFEREGLAAKLKSADAGKLSDLPPAHAFLGKYKIALV